MVRERRACLLGLERGLYLAGVDLKDLVGYVGGVDEHAFPRVLRQVRLRHDRPALDRVLRGARGGAITMSRSGFFLGDLGFQKNTLGSHSLREQRFKTLPLGRCAF